MDQKFYRCSICGNMVAMLEDHNVPLFCCGQEMKELVANTEDASVEKHVPALTIEDSCVTVQVGSVTHPMEEGHHITFVYIKTKNGGQRKSLAIGAEPKVSFCLCDDELLAVYAWCNLHGLWKATP